MPLLVQVGLLELAGVVGELTINNAHLTMNRSSVLRNKAGDGGDGDSGYDGGIGGNGGGIASFSSSQVILIDSIVNLNDAGDGGIGGSTSGVNANDGGNGGFGGGFYCDGCELATLETNFYYNNSGSGGYGGTASGLTLTGGDGGAGGNGAGLYVKGSDTNHTMDSISVKENFSGDAGLGGKGSGGSGSDGWLGNGGGLYITQNVQATIRYSTFNENRAEYGGGIFVAGTADIYLLNSTISENRAAHSGGGISVVNSSYATLDFVTITQNVADWDNPTNPGGDGGGVDSVASLTLQYSIVAGNSDKGGENPDCNGTVASAGSSLIGISNSVSCIFTPDPSDLLGTTASPIDPLLNNLADNGGPTWTHALQPDSPAVNYISSSQLRYNIYHGPTLCSPFPSM